MCIRDRVCTSPRVHAECTRPSCEYDVSAFISSGNSFLVLFSMATLVHARRKRVESKTLSNKAVGSSGSDICFAPRERERDRKWGAILSGLRRKNLPTEVVQEAEFARSRHRNCTASLSCVESGTRAEPLRRVCRRWSRNRASPRVPLSAVSSALVFLTCRERATCACCFSPTRERSRVRTSERSGLHFALGPCRMH